MRRKNNLTPVLWVSAGLLLIFLSQQIGLGPRLTLAFAPVMDVLSAPARWWQETGLWFRDREQLQAEYLQQKEILERKAAMVQEVSSLREENRQLRNLLRIPQIQQRYWQAVKVEGRSPDAMNQRLVIVAEGARPDDVVVSSSGLVGVIDTVSTNYAVIRTILDASLAVPVTIEGRPLAALVRGQGNSLMVDFVPWADAPPAGSILQTSGAGGIFPPGIPVARITEISEREGEVFADVEAETLAHWQRENWLAVALKPSKE